MDVAPHLAEHPVAEEGVGEREGHDDGAEAQVGDGQRRDEPVLGRDSTLTKSRRLNPVLSKFGHPC